MKNILKVMALCALPLAAYGQSDSKNANDFRTYNFFQVQGGLHLPFTPGERADLMKPNFGINVGRWFAPELGARIGVEGLNSTVFNGTEYKDLDYFTTNLDVLFNLTDLFKKGNNHKMNIHFLAGMGLAYCDNSEAQTNLRSNHSELFHNFRVGLAGEWKIAKPLSLSLEYRLNNTDDDFNARINGEDDWYSSLLVGLTCNFGYNKKLYSDKYVVVPEKELTMYDKMQMSVNDRMNTWMKRLKGESKDDYLLRTSEDKIEAMRLSLTNEVTTEMAGDKIANSNVSLGKYNKNAELLGVNFSDMPSITLSVPKNEITAFKKAEDLNFNKTVYGLNANDQFEVLYTEVLNANNSKTYVYNNLNRQEAKKADTEGFVPLEVVQQEIANSLRLEQVKTNAVQQAKNEKLLTDNTTIEVAAEVVPNGDQLNYKVTYKYAVKDGFSVTDDFAPGKYVAEKSPASTAMLNIIKESFAKDFAPYVKAGKSVKIIYTGSADATPINGKLTYKGEYGDINNQAVVINGKPSKLTVTKADGITSNEQLSLVRAISVKDFTYKNIPALKNMKTTDNYVIEVSPNKGSEYRRVTVEFLFENAF